jgi:hypothetical protein
MRAAPVELLRDGRGIYGIGVSDLFDYEAVAWSCGIEPELWEHENPGALILRWDRLVETKPRYAVLQRIVGGFRRSIFHHSVEERLRQFIHHEALRRAGLCWPPRPNRDDPEWWSHDKKWQAHNRGIYHGLRLRSLQVINNLIGKALEEAADADAVKAARRFCFNHRENIYRAAALSRRALQLTDTFPVLALALYSAERWQRSDDLVARQNSAAALVERGARLRDVAAAMDIPMALRRIKPGAAHLLAEVFCEHPEIMHFMPEALPRSKVWLQLVRWANHNVGVDYAKWIAKNLAQIPGGLQQAGAFVSDLADWVRACTTTEADERVLPEVRGKQFVARPFTPSMSLKTVTKLSADWHEAVAADMSGPRFAFPSPWYPAAKLGTYEILPIESSAELYREGAAMHHCAGTYACEVKCGAIYVYSIRGDGERLATLELGRNGNRPALIQLRGPCNAQPPKEITAIVQRWLRAQPPLQQQDPPRRNYVALRAKYEAEQLGDADGIPF